MKITLHGYAKFVAFFTACLIFVGGLVTSTGSGLSVPDWPLSFGKFFPRMTGGVFFEHGHRMVAGTVMILSALLLIWILRAEKSPSVRWLAIGAMGAVVLQAILGGMTVLLKLPPVVSVAHAALAQAFFCAVVSLAVITGADWKKESSPWADPRVPSLRILVMTTTCLIYVQILLGAVMRHIGAGLAIPDFPLAFGAILPPREIFSLPVAIHFAHRVGAFIVSLFVAWSATRIFQIRTNERGLRTLGVTALALLFTQILLGAMTIWTRKAVFPTTLHVVVGALLLANHVILSLKVFRSERISRSLFVARPVVA